MQPATRESRMMWIVDRTSGNAICKECQIAGRRKMVVGSWVSLSGPKVCEAELLSGNTLLMSKYLIQEARLGLEWWGLGTLRALRD